MSIRSVTLTYSPVKAGWTTVAILWAGAVFWPSAAPAQERPGLRPPATAAQAAQRLRDRDRHEQESADLRFAGKLEEAVVAAERMLADEREMYGDFHYEIAGSLLWLAELHDEREDYSAALKARQTRAAVLANLDGETHARVVAARQDVNHAKTLAGLDEAQRKKLAATALRVRQAAAPQTFKKGTQGKPEPKAPTPLEANLDAFKVRKELLGPTHPKCLETADKINPLYEKQVWTLFSAARKYVPATNAYSTDQAALRTAKIKAEEWVEFLAAAYGPRHWKAVTVRIAADHFSRVAELSDPDRYKVGAIFGYYDLNVERFFNNESPVSQDGTSFKGSFAQAVRIAEARKKFLGQEDVEYAVSLNNLGMLCKTMGDLDQAEQYLIQALAIRKKKLGEDHPWYAMSLSNLGGVWVAKGDYKRAGSALVRATTILEETVGATHPGYVASLNNLAAYCASIRDFAAAGAHLRKAADNRRQFVWRTFRDGDSNIPHLPGFFDAARIESSDGRAQGAGGFAGMPSQYSYGTSVTARQMRVDDATIINNLALVRHAQGHLPEANALFQGALEATEKAIGKKNSLYAATLSNLAHVCGDQKDYEQAEVLLRRAVGIRKETLGEKHWKYATSLNNLGLLAVRTGKPKDAETMLRQALDIRKASLGNSHYLVADSLENLAAAAEAAGDRAKATALVEAALPIAHQNFRLAAAAESERQQLIMAQAWRGYLDHYLSLTRHSSGPSGEAYRHVLAWKGTAAANQASVRETRKNPGRPDVEKLWAEFEAVTRRLATLALAVPETGREGPWRDRIGELTTRKETLERDLARAAAPPPADEGDGARALQALQKCLPPKTVLIDLIEYLDNDSGPGDQGKAPARRLAAFIVTSAAVARVDLGPAVPIAKAVDRWRRDIATVNSGAHATSGPALHRLVWRPLLAQVNGAQTVLISPDGATCRIAWPALPGAAAGSFLIEDFMVCIIPVPRLLPALLASPPVVAEPSLLMVGDVDFDAAGVGAGQASEGRDLPWRQKWFALPGTRAEIAGVGSAWAERFPKARMTELRGGAATTTAIRRQAPAHTHLHIATHGFFAPPSLKAALGPRDSQSALREETLFGDQGISGFHPGLLSGLVLAGGNRGPTGDDEGLLTALEVAGLNLGGVDLTVLSACETGLGETATGEGVLGLQRAFQIAGSKTTVATLWSVDDKATQELMNRFYDNLWGKRMPRLTALREAQIWLLKEGRIQDGIRRGYLERLGKDATATADGRLPPYYWAAFVLSGDWR